MKFEATSASVIAKGLGVALVEKEGRRGRSRRPRSDKVGVLKEVAGSKVASILLSP